MRLKPCLTCGQLSPRSRCDQHNRSNWDGYRATNPEANDMGTGWRALRARVLTEEPRCRRCGSVATDVDHATPRALGGTDDRANLQSLCSKCHGLKTHQDGKAVRAARRMAHA